MTGQHGDIVEGETCPDCGEYPIVYNGNYLCDGWGNWCNWAMPEEHTPEHQRIINRYLRQIEES